MMSNDEQNYRAIAFLAARCRPTGSKPWDEAGIVANLRKVGHISLPELAMATIRAAANRACDNPGVIPNLGGEHWREKVAERDRWRPPKRDEECRTHLGQYASNCGGCRADQLAIDEPDEQETPMPNPSGLTGAAMVRAQLAQGGN